MMKKLSVILIVCMLLLPFITLDWSMNGIHDNGLMILGKMAVAAATPDLSVLGLSLKSAMVTIAYATTGISLALVLGFGLGIVASGIIVPNKKLMGMTKNLLAAMRAVHELIWALFFVASIGLSPYSAIFAIAIPYGGMLGKIFCDIMETVSVRKVMSIREMGGSRWQVFFYCYLPEAYNDLVSYGLYRYECAIRSSAVLSFVGVAGLGLQIQLTLYDLKFNQMFTHIYVLILIVWAMDYWGTHYRQGRIKRPLTNVLMMSLVAISWIFIGLTRANTHVLSMQNLTYAWQFILKMVGIGSGQPAFLNPVEIVKVLGYVWETFQMSLMAITISGLLMLLVIVPASRGYGTRVFAPMLKALFLITRGVPELIWAMIIVFVIRPGVFAGALALAIHNFGILSKLCTEVIEELEEGPIMNLKHIGATKGQILIYAVFPMAYKRIIGYLIYRWEIILRTTIVVGIVGAGGLGYYFRTSLSWFHYTEVTLVLICYFILVKMADHLSEKLKRLFQT